MGNRIQRVLAWLRLFKKRPRLYTITKTGRLLERYKKIDRKQDKLIFTTDPIKAITENVDITCSPLKDDATERHIYFHFEGETKTIDLFGQKTKRSESDDLALAAAFDRGREFERTYQEDRVQDKKIIYLFIGLIFLNLAILVLVWQITGKVG